MIDFSAVARRGWGGAARMPLRAIPSRLRMPILQGPARGFWWRVGAGDHGCWLGSYEREAQCACRRILRIGDVACDVGANAGFFSLVMSRLVGSGGAVIAFEPLASNVAELGRTLARNGVTNVEVVAAAVADRTGTSRFARGDSAFDGRLDHQGDQVVSTMALDEVFGGDVRLPRLIKIDVEGAAPGVVRGARRLLTHRVSTLLFELHDADERDAVERELDAVGYRLVNLQGAPIIADIDWSVFLRALGIPASGRPAGHQVSRAHDGEAPSQ